VFAPQVHPPTRVLKWWTAMQAALRFGNFNTLQRVLCRLLEKTYRIGRRVAGRMRSPGRQRLDPKLVLVRFKVCSGKRHR